MFDKYENLKRLYSRIAKMKTIRSGRELCAGRYMSISEECFLKCVMSLAFIKNQNIGNIDLEKLYSSVFVSSLIKSLDTQSEFDSKIALDKLFAGFKNTDYLLYNFSQKNIDFNLESGVIADIEKLMNDDFACYPRLKKLYFDMLKLCRLERTGWVKRGLVTSRIESVAEHMVSSAFLADVFYHERELFGLDAGKIISMLLLHEVGTVGTNDATPTSNITAGKKFVLEQSSAQKILGSFADEELYKLYVEYEKQKVIEARFAKTFDKLDAVLQSYNYECVLKNKKDITSSFLKDREIKTDKHYDYFE